MSFVSGILGFLNRRTDGKSLDEIVNKRTGGRFKTLDELINTRDDGISLSDILAGEIDDFAPATDNVIKRLEAIQTILNTRTPTDYRYYGSFEFAFGGWNNVTGSSVMQRSFTPDYSGSGLIVVSASNTNSGYAKYVHINGTTYYLNLYTSSFIVVPINFTKNVTTTFNFYTQDNYVYASAYIGATLKPIYS